MDKEVIIAIPIYKTHLNDSEQISLKQCFKILGNYPIIFIKPKALDISMYLKYVDKYPFKSESFSAHFFKDIRGYNQLMLSQKYYERFLDYKYMLIYQLDAFVFKDELLHWCRKGYDYIGAPWLMREKTTRKIRSYFFRKFNKKQKDGVSPHMLQFYNRVGNGGFSLRNIRKFLELCSTHKTLIDFYNGHSDSNFYNEDVFWSLEVNRRGNILKIPGYKEALHFSIEQNPDLALRLLDGALPFGVHAWPLFFKHWKSIIEQAMK